MENVIIDVGNNYGISIIIVYWEINCATKTVRFGSSINTPFCGKMVRLQLTKQTEYVKYLIIQGVPDKKTVLSFCIYASKLDQFLKCLKKLFDFFWRY